MTLTPGISAPAAAPPAAPTATPWATSPAIRSLVAQAVKVRLLASATARNDLRIALFSRVVDRRARKTGRDYRRSACHDHRNDVPPVSFRWRDNSWPETEAFRRILPLYAGGA